ncbi:MAG: RNA-binding S4 domain-containing protein [Betaproteobacteria bacterium]
MDTAPNRIRIRIDKWLWAARFFKTRSLAAQAVDLGRVRLAGERIKPAREVHAGDRYEIAVGEQRLEIVVLGVSHIRGPAPAARLLYEETPESIARRTRLAEGRRLGAEPALALKGRPTKRDRRELGRLQGGDGSEAWVPGGGTADW